MPTEKSLGKTLIFNNGINTSLYVYMKHLEKRGILFVILITPVAQRNVKIFYSGLKNRQF
jgi:hypothetical protein